MGFVLTACSETGRGNSTGAFTPTATLLRQGVAMKTFTGPDFTIRYPADWKSTADYGPAIFVDPTRTYDLLIGSKLNPDGLIPPEQVIKNGLKRGDCLDRQVGQHHEGNSRDVRFERQ